MFYKTVHPVPAPTSTKAELNNNNKEGGNSQKLMLFNLGNAISGAPINMGTNQLPNPPINAGITIKKSWVSLEDLRLSTPHRTVRDCYQSYGSPLKSKEELVYEVDRFTFE